MKTLVLVRHARAAGRHKHLSDLERPLTPRGQKAAKRAARELKARGTAPTLLVSSPANRALETAHIFAKELDYPIHKIALRQSAYDAMDAEALLSTLRETGDQHDIVVLFGHNPSMEDLAASLLQGFAGNLPKAGVVEISISKDSWRDLLPGDGRRIIEQGELPAPHSLPTVKELRGDLRPKIEIQLRQLIDGLHESGADKITEAIQEVAEALAKRLAKVIKADQVG